MKEEKNIEITDAHTMRTVLQFSTMGRKEREFEEEKSRHNF